MSRRVYRIGPFSLLFLNLMLVWLYLWLLLHRDPEFLLSAAFMASVIVAAQTPILLRLKGITTRLLVLYASMLLFLFCFGVSSVWNLPVGSHPAGSWLARFDGGLRISLLGQIFGFPAFLLIALANIAVLKRSPV